MSRLKLLLAATLFAVLAACAGGLFVDEGNAFLCSPANRPPRGVQDPQCPTGWACAVTEQCVKFDLDEIDERRVNVLAEPPRVFPLPGLDGPYLDIAGPSFERPVIAVLSKGADSGFLVDLEARNVQSFPLPVLAPGMTIVETAATGRELAVITAQGPFSTVSLSTLNGRFRTVELADGGGVLRDAFALRGFLLTADAGSFPVIYIQRLRRQDSEPVALAGEVGIPQNPFAPPLFRAFTVVQRDGGRVGGPGLLSDGGAAVAHEVVDARPIPRAAILRQPCAGLGSVADAVVPVAVATEGLFLRTCRGLGGTFDDWISLVGPDEPELPLSPLGEPPKLRTDPSYDVFAVSFNRRASGLKRQHNALSAWRLNRTGATPSVERTWQDCTPCGGERVVTFAPLLSQGVAAVDVACEIKTATDGGDDTSVRVVRVTGSAGSGAEDSCAFSPIDVSINPLEIGGEPFRIIRADVEIVRPRYPIADYLGSGLIIGGKHGQLWRGASFESLRPMFLDRVPQAVSSLAGKPFALTEDYAAYQLIDGGLVVVDDKALIDPTGAPVRPRSAPGDARNQNLGWVVLEGADLAKVVYDGGVFSAGVGGGVSVTFGSPMIDAAASSPPPPYNVELLQTLLPDDAGVGESFAITAFDSLYVSSKALRGVRGALPPLVPELTPQPGAIIRSLAINRHLVASRSIKARGHLISGRTLYAIELNDDNRGAQRWIAREVNIGGGEPLQVFTRFDGDEQDIARVAFRDGQILSLPAGVSLLAALPTKTVDGKGTTTAEFSGRALSFATMNGVPLVLTEDGLWTPKLMELPDSDPPRLSSTYSWIQQPLPADLRKLDDAARRERMKTARLQVLNEPSGQVLYLFTEFGFVYKLATAPPQ